MKKAQRQPYLILNKVKTPIGYPCLCNWCKFAEWSGFESACSDGDLDCGHPLEVVQENCIFAWADQGDCWGFRPNISPEVAADIVGMWLRKEWPDWATVPILGRG